VRRRKATPKAAVDLVCTVPYNSPHRGRGTANETCSLAMEPPQIAHAIRTVLQAQGNSFSLSLPLRPDPTQHSSREARDRGGATAGPRHHHHLDLSER